jgi:hypothetical protein
MLEGRHASWRLPVVARLLVCAAALAGLVIGAIWVVAPYRDVIAYRHAHRCSVGAPDAGCLADDTGAVLDKDTGQRCSSRDDGSAGGGGEDCTTYYRLRLRRARGTEWLEVRYDIYQGAARDDVAQLRTWHGAVVRLELRGHTEDYDPPANGTVYWRVALLWLLLGLAIWAAASGYLGTLFAFPNFGWLFAAIPFAVLGRALLLGFSVTDYIMLLIFVPFCVLWIRSAWSISGAGHGRWWRPSRPRSRR